MVYISTQNLSLSMRQSVLQTQSNMATAQKEVASGVYADLGMQLGGQTSNAISLAQQSAQLTSLTASNALATTRLSATSTAIDTIMSTAQSLSENLVSDGTDGSISSTIQAQSQSSLQSLLGLLNTDVGGQYIFAGTNTADAPMTSYSDNSATTSAALTSDLAGLNADPSQITGDQMTAYLADPTSQFAKLFQTGSNWSALSSASTTPISTKISPTQSVTTSVSASQTGFQDIAKAYALLNGLGSQNLSQGASSAVIASATNLLNIGMASLTTVQANVGVAQNSITTASTQMGAQQTILTNNVNDLEDVDTYTLSTRVTALQTQLQDAYSLTSQLKSLSLVNYLTGG